MLTELNVTIRRQSSNGKDGGRLNLTQIAITAT